MSDPRRQDMLDRERVATQRKHWVRVTTAHWTSRSS